MKKSLIVIMLILLVVVLVVVLVAAPAVANSSYTYELNHSFDLQMDGEFTFNSNVVTPSQGAVDMALDGTGTAALSSQLSILEVNQVSANWYDLF